MSEADDYIDSVIGDDPIEIDLNNERLYDTFTRLSIERRNTMSDKQRDSDIIQRGREIAEGASREPLPGNAGIVCPTCKRSFLTYPDFTAHIGSPTCANEITESSQGGGEAGEIANRLADDLESSGFQVFANVVADGSRVEFDYHGHSYEAHPRYRPDAQVERAERYRDGMLHAARIVRNEFNRAPKAARDHDSVWMGGYESACDHLAVAIERAAVIDCVEVSKDTKKRAREIVVQFMNTISEGEGDYSCNECELDTHLCPHLFARLVDRIAAALEPQNNPTELEAELATTRYNWQKEVSQLQRDRDEAAAHMKAACIDAAMRKGEEFAPLGIIRRVLDELIHELEQVEVEGEAK